MLKIFGPISCKFADFLQNKTETSQNSQEKINATCWFY